MPAEDLLFAELERHQELLLPHTAAHLGLRNLDVGCGSGVASVIHTSRLGLSPTLSDVIDIRHPSAGALPFQLINAGVLPFEAQAFDSSYLQYVLHHVFGAERIAALLKECSECRRRWSSLKRWLVRTQISRVRGPLLQRLRQPALGSPWPYGEWTLMSDLRGRGGLA